MGAINEMSKQNMAMVEKTMRMFNPFNIDASGSRDPVDQNRMEAEYHRLKAQFEDLHRQIYGKKTDKK
jgi:polyhydroxyalkanoate synthesis regulator protein